MYVYEAVLARNIGFAIPSEDFPQEAGHAAEGGDSCCNPLHSYTLHPKLRTCNPGPGKPRRPSTPTPDPQTSNRRIRSGRGRRLLPTPRWAPKSLSYDAL